MEDIAERLGRLKALCLRNIRILVLAGRAGEPGKDLERKLEADCGRVRLLLAKCRREILERMAGAGGRLAARAEALAAGTETHKTTSEETVGETALPLLTKDFLRARRDMLQVARTKNVDLLSFLKERSGDRPDGLDGLIETFRICRTGTDGETRLLERLTGGTLPDSRRDA